MRITKLTLFTNQLKETKHFYNNVLGFKILEEKGAEILFKTGETKLVFKETKSPCFYHFAFNIPHNKFKEAFEFIEKKAGVLQAVEDGAKTFDFPSWNARAFYFHDNNKNIVEFIARFDLENQINQPFEIGNTCEISEIGISVDNVSEETTKINDKLKTSYFEKRQPRKDFAAIGDDNGLLIFAETNRNWFPTHQKGEKYPTIIEIEEKEKTHVLSFYE